MQRVRIGLTGLGFVFLVVLLAAVFTSQTRDEAPVTANLVEPRATGMPAQAPHPEAQAAEPLATLGVAPGNVDSNDSARNDSAPPPADR